MPRFNIPIHRQYTRLASARVAQERRLRMPIAMVGANDPAPLSSLASGAFFKILTSVSMLTAGAAAFLAWRLTQLPH